LTKNKKYVYIKVNILVLKQLNIGEKMNVLNSYLALLGLSLCFLFTSCNESPSQSTQINSVEKDSACIMFNKYYNEALNLEWRSVTEAGYQITHSTDTSHLETTNLLYHDQLIFSHDYQLFRIRWSEWFGGAVLKIARFVVGNNSYDIIYWQPDIGTRDCDVRVTLNSKELLLIINEKTKQLILTFEGYENDRILTAPKYLNQLLLLRSWKICGGYTGSNMSEISLSDTVSIRKYRMEYMQCYD
jgi:hypothetical protein